MVQYTVTGMSCAACSTRVEKAVGKVDGVSSCSVSLLTNSMGIEGDAQASDIIEAVEKAGYHAELKDNNDSKQSAAGSNSHNNSDAELDITKKEITVLKNRLVASLVFLIILMYFSMGHMMWNWPLPAILENNHIAMGLIQLLLTTIVMVINQHFFISGFKGLIHGAPNMDTLVALGSAAAYIYSTYALFAMTNAQVIGDSKAVMEYMHEFYYESAAMILTLITVGKMLEARSKGRTTDALKGLMKLAPKTAVIIRDGKEQKVAVEEVRIGDVFVVRPGENIPVDGIVIEGNSAVNESALTGESIPVDKNINDSVFAATTNQSGYIQCKASRVGESTTLSQIIQMVSDAAATKAPIAKVADKVSGIFVPTVIAIAIVTMIVLLITGAGVGYALARAISVLVISCPCALGLATPVAIMVGNGVAAKNGIMFKTAVSLETTGRTQIVALDKTGTITSGEPVVTDIYAADNVMTDELLCIANSLEQKSEHPLAKAIVKYGKDNSIENKNVDGFKALAGNGLSGNIDGISVYGGNYSYISSKVNIDNSIEEIAEKFANQGKTPLYFADAAQLLGIIAVADVIKEDSARAVSDLQKMGMKVVMLTGDNELTAKAIGKQAGVDEVIAGVLPEGKEEVIRKLKEQGKVAMVGDGINDAPALTRADIGIAIGAGTDIAIDAADVVLMKSSLSDVPAAITLSKKTLKNIHENLFWAFFYNCVGIPLAAGVWIPLFHWELNPMFGAAAMSLSSFCVVTNALRLNLVKLNNNKASNKTNNIEKRKNTMNKTMKIEGMMCGHCEARVKKTLEALDGVKEAVVSHTEGTAVVTLDTEVSDEVLTNAVEAQDYKVISII